MVMKPDTVRQTLAALRGYKVSSTRAAQLAGEVERVNEAARKAAVRTDFNAQPSDFSVVLAELARK